MNKIIYLILSMILSFTSFGHEGEKKNVKNESAEKSPSGKSLYERLAEKGRGEIKESADSGRTGGGAKTSTIEK